MAVSGAAVGGVCAAAAMPRRRSAHPSNTSSDSARHAGRRAAWVPEASIATAPRCLSVLPATGPRARFNPCCVRAAVPRCGLGTLQHLSVCLSCTRATSQPEEKSRLRVTLTYFLSKHESPMAGFFSISPFPGSLWSRPPFTPMASSRLLSWPLGSPLCAKQPVFSDVSRLVILILVTIEYMYINIIPLPA